MGHKISYFQLQVSFLLKLELLLCTRLLHYQKLCHAKKHTETKKFAVNVASSTQDSTTTSRSLRSRDTTAAMEQRQLRWSKLAARLQQSCARAVDLYVPALTSNNASSSGELNTSEWKVCIEVVSAQRARVCCRVDLSLKHGVISSKGKCAARAAHCIVSSSALSLSLLSWLSAVYQRIRGWRRQRRRRRAPRCLSTTPQAQGAAFAQDPQRSRSSASNCTRRCKCRRRARARAHRRR